MSLRSQVAWREGIFMVPQHFQQAERALDASLFVRFQGLDAMHTGLEALIIDENALAHGRFSVLECQAVLPDGAVVDIPRSDTPPAVRAFELPTNNDPLDVYLTLATRQPRTALVTREADFANARFLEREVKAPDDFAPDQERPIKVATKNFRLVFSRESLDGRVGLKIARVVRRADGVPVLDAAFIPSGLWLSASPYLTSQLRKIATLVSARAKALRDRAGGARDFVPDDLKGFGFLHTLHQSMPVLEQLVRHPRIHPFVVFQELLRLAGGLSTFDARYVENLPFYDHESPTEPFAALFRILEALLGQQVKATYLILPMTRSDAYWNVRIEDPNLLSSGSFYLAILARLQGQEQLTFLLKTLRISDPDNIDRVVTRALSGLGASLVPGLPTSVPSRGEGVFLQLKLEGTYWETIKQLGQMSLYLPGFLKDAKVELIGLFGGGRS